MSGELQADTSTSQTVYFLIRTTTSTIWNGVSFENYNAGNYSAYVVASTEQGASGFYIGNMPSVSAGQYTVTAKLQVGGSPAQSDPTVSEQSIDWGGSAVGVVVVGIDSSLSTYQAKIWLIDDGSPSSRLDRYMVAWFQDSQPLSVGITSPTLQVFTTTGSNLIPTSAMTQAGTTGTYYYTSTTAQRVVDGQIYMAKAQAIINAVTRTWLQPVGRDA